MTEPPLEIFGVPKRLPMTRALVALLAEVTGMPWEIGRIPTIPDPANAGRQISVDPTFGILYPQWRTTTGPVRRPIVTWNYQATVAVKRADQLEVFDDKIQAAIAGRAADMSFAYPLQVAGLNIIDRVIGPQNTGGTDQTPDTRTEMPTRDIRFAVTVNAHEETP